MTEARAHPTLTTERLLLRPWRDADRAPFAALNADPRVMEHFPSCLTAAESDALMDKIIAHFERRGFGLWAVQVRAGPAFIGFVGLSTPTFEAAFTPCVEVGWRLRVEHQGRGYATEAGAAAIKFGFDVIGLSEIVSFTSVNNAPSRRVMEKLGMRRDPLEDFEHPKLAPGDPLRAHVLYRIGADGR